MSLRVSVVDIETGDHEECVVADGDYLLLTVRPCFEAYVNAYPKSGTHVITVKNCRPRRAVSGTPQEKEE